MRTDDEPRNASEQLTKRTTIRAEVKHKLGGMQWDRPRGIFRLESQRYR